jgi:molybdate transport system permease protein
MDWSAFLLSLRLAAWTCVLLLPIAVLIARPLAWRRFPGKSLIEASLILPLVLPPTVLGFYLMVGLGNNSPLGELYSTWFGSPLVFTFEGLLVASLVVNLPFAVQPLQRAFEAIPPEVREAAWCSGLSTWQTFWRIELPLAWPGLLSALALTFAHTIGEFGVVLMVGGNIPGETRTIAIAIYDHAQALDFRGAGLMSAFLLALALLTVALVLAMTRKIGRRHG